ncbi:LysR family transcriptional regulator [Corynebacterium testudinoris]|nr:LysR family transcriptional regulator [Corynebacterium testudinoris]MBX8996145.1 LysR family transcriptional regulator [Corynebacterium testudinoris]
MELQQMRYVAAIAEEQNFTRAAERCFVVQSALSHQIKALERELGVKLFARSSRRVELTAAGEAFLVQARASLDAADRAVSAAAAANGEIRGTLTVGVIPTVTTIDIPAALGTFHRTHPAVRIKLHSGGSDEFIAAIKAGSMDVAVLGLPDSTPPTGVNTHVLARDRLAAVVSAEHPLAKRHEFQLADLTNEAFVDFPAGTPGRIPSDLAFQAVGVSREVTFEAMSTELILNLIRQGLVIALLSPTLIPADSRDLRVIPVESGPTRVEYLAWSNFNPTPAAQAFLKSLPLPLAP